MPKVCCYERSCKPAGCNLIPKKHRRRTLLSFTNGILTGAAYFAYPVLLISLMFQRDMRWISCFWVPALSFLLLSLFRRLINAPRPYEQSQELPLLNKSTCGKAFPSRHVFSMAVIAMTFFRFSVIWGIVFSGFTVLLAIVRVVGGVHDLWDVTAGALWGILAGLIGYFLC